MQHTGTPQELADKTQRARTLGYQALDLIQRLDAIHPGSTRGEITGLGFTIRRTSSGWTLIPQ